MASSDDKCPEEIDDRKSAIFYVIFSFFGFSLTISMILSELQYFVFVSSASDLPNIDNCFYWLTNLFE